MLGMSSAWCRTRKTWLQRACSRAVRSHIYRNRWYTKVGCSMMTIGRLMLAVLCCTKWLLNISTALPRPATL